MVRRGAETTDDGQDVLVPDVRQEGAKRPVEQSRPMFIGPAMKGGERCTVSSLSWYW